MALEITHDRDGVIATFDHPGYEMNGYGPVFDGEVAVRAHFAGSRTPFPHQGNEMIAIAADGDTVLVEFWLTRTHTGPLKVGDRVIAPTRRSFRVPIAASLEFKLGTDRIVCEHPYFDQGAVLKARQLT